MDRYDRAAPLSALALGIALSVLGACTGRPESPTDRVASQDSSFAAVQTRGREVMGVDQYTSAHVFEDLPDGGRIILDREMDGDSVGVAAIRHHMREIAADFRAGEFTKPLQVHARVVPGTDIMTARRERIAYEVSDRPRGAELRIRTTDSTAIAAVHRFLAFQRADHHAAGHEHGAAASPMDMHHHP